jgi:diguanylate cyclase (GGDEF)-like protein
MPLIEPVSSLSIKRSVNLYTLVLFISFGVLLYWLATDRYQVFVNTHENIANTSAKIMAFQVNKILEEQKREIDIFVDDSHTLLTNLSVSPDNIKFNQILSNRLKKHQPNANGYNIFTKTGAPLLNNPVSRDYQSRTEDIKNHIQDDEHTIRLHPDGNGYHYDIISRFSGNQSDHIFLVSFGINEISDLLNSTQSQKHNLVLVNKEPNNSIGITSQGTTKKVSGFLNFKIHNGVDLITLSKTKVKNTNWYVVDMSDVDLFSGYRNKIITEFLIAYYIFAMIVLFMRYILLKQDAKRSLAEEQLKNNHEQIKVLNNSLDLLSKKDGLTNLYNRRYFDEMAKHEWNRGIRTLNTLSCILLDIDHFKDYNDHYGHQAGDKCIKDISDLLKKSFRRSGDIVARYGGEEFIVIMSDSSEDEAKVAIIKFQLALAKLKIPHKASKTNSFVTTSAGVIVQIPLADGTIGAFVKNADKALYLAKEAGRNQWVLHKKEKRSHWARTI